MSADNVHQGYVLVKFMSEYSFCLAEIVPAKLHLWSVQSRRGCLENTTKAFFLSSECVSVLGRRQLATGSVAIPVAWVSDTIGGRPVFMFSSFTWDNKEKSSARMSTTLDAPWKG